MRNELAQERLKQLLHYDPETGVFTYKTPRKKCSVGKVAGTYRKDGYLSLTIDRKRYLGHRLAWLYVHGSMPDYVDHIDCNPSDNRICNLRPATISQNKHNEKLRSNNTSGVKGVTWDISRNKWTVNVWVNGKGRFIGRFDSIDDASKAADKARAELHKEFANNG